MRRPNAERRPAQSASRTRRGNRNGCSGPSWWMCGGSLGVPDGRGRPFIGTTTVEARDRAGFEGRASPAPEFLFNGWVRVFYFRSWRISSIIAFGVLRPNGIVVSSAPAPITRVKCVSHPITSCLDGFGAAHGTHPGAAAHGFVRGYIDNGVQQRTGCSIRRSTEQPNLQRMLNTIKNENLRYWHCAKYTGKLD